MTNPLKEVARYFDQNKKMIENGKATQPKRCNAILFAMFTDAKIIECKISLN